MTSVVGGIIIILLLLLLLVFFFFEGEGNNFPAWLGGCLCLPLWNEPGGYTRTDITAPSCLVLNNVLFER